MVPEEQNTSLFLRMLEAVIEKFDTTCMGDYFSPDFELESNRCLMTYQEYQNYLIEIFQYLKSIELKKPFADIIAEKDKIAVRFSVIVTDSVGISEQADIIAIVQFKDHKIFRWWELSYPDWQME